jgi:cytochrome c553
MNRSLVRRAAAIALAASSVLLAGGSAWAAEKDAGANQAAQKVAATICASCHGMNGNSTSPLFPRLAGQQERYLAAQLRAFKAKTRGEQDAHDYMWGMATLLDESVIDAIARYYAAQKPAPGTPGNAALISRGKILFEKGDPAHDLVACATCHGEGAQGNAIFPRLAGQHSAYVVRQLQAIQRQFRDSPVMHGVIKDIDADGMNAVAEYVQSL